MILKHVLPYGYLMAAAKETAADFNLDYDLDNTTTTVSSDLGTEPEGDRGDDFDPALFEEQEDAPRKPTAESPEKDKPEPGKDKPEPESDAGKDKPEPESDTGKDKPVEKDDKPEPDKKPSRAERRVQQLLERNAALERQLQERAQVEATSKVVSDLEAEAAKLEADYHKALAEDPEKAASIMRKIREHDRQIARAEAQAQAEAAITERLETRELQQAISEIVEQFPELEQGSEVYDANLVSDVNAVFAGLLTTSVSKAAAMRKAVKLVMGEKTPVKEPTLGDKAAEIRRQRAEEARVAAAKTSTAQPPSTQEAGRTNTSTRVPAIRSIKDLESIDEAELARLRGDEV